MLIILKTVIKIIFYIFLSFGGFTYSNSFNFQNFLRWFPKLNLAYYFQENVNQIFPQGCFLCLVQLCNFLGSMTKNIFLWLIIIRNYSRDIKQWHNYKCHFYNIMLNLKPWISLLQFTSISLVSFFTFTLYPFSILLKHSKRNVPCSCNAELSSDNLPSHIFIVFQNCHVHWNILYKKIWKSIHKVKRVSIYYTIAVFYVHV